MLWASTGRSRATLERATKAWRFVGEMEQAALAYEAAGLPGGFHRAAAAIARSTRGT